MSRPSRSTLATWRRTLWTIWLSLPAPSSGNPKDRALFVPVFSEVRKHEIIGYWYDRLVDPLHVAEYSEVVVFGLQPGAEDMFLDAANGDRRYPSFGRLKGTLISAWEFPVWIVYFLLVEPVDDATLPNLGYVGSGTASAGQFTGGESRSRSRSRFRNFK